VQAHLLKVGISIVTVSAPASGREIQLNVTSRRRIRSYLEDSIAKVRSRAMIPKSGMKDAQRSPIGEPQFVATKTLMMPDALQQTFRRNTAAIAESSEGVA
jgi:hypothetical protein